MSDEKVSEKTYKERLSICKKCPDRKGTKLAFSRCGLCGCPIATKALLPMWHCPAKKW